MTPAFKIFTQPQWDAFEKSGRFEGSPDDIRDGFIHLSYQDQLPGTVTKYFNDEPVIVLAIVTPRDPVKLKDEVSRGGALFPHYFTHLTSDEMGTPHSINRGDDGYDEASLITALKSMVRS